MSRDMLQEAKDRFVEELDCRVQAKCSGIDLKAEVVVGRPLSSREALGEPKRDDFPILRGKEVLMQAAYRGALGQAFTPAGGSYVGRLEDILQLPLNGFFERAVLISTINAVLRYLGLIEGTVHCKDEGPARCAGCLAEWIKDQKAEAVGLIGMQPALLEALARVMGPGRVMVSDLSLAGTERCGIRILDGMESQKIFEGCEIVLITGSALANGTMDSLMDSAARHRNRVVFFGTTIAGVAYLLNLERWCPAST